MPGRTKNKSLPETRKIRGLKLKLRKREILRQLRYTSGTGRITPEIEEIIQEEIQRAYQLIYPSVLYRTVFRESESFANLQKKIIKGPDKIEKISSSAVAVTLMAATAGKKIEEKIDSMKKKDLTGAVILDAAGSEAAEQAVNFVSKLISQQARKQDCYAGMRFSPGYSGWSVGVNEKILRVLKGGRIGIKYQSSGIMTPRKSVVAVQGWFKQ